MTVFGNAHGIEKVSGNKRNNERIKLCSNKCYNLNFLRNSD